MEEMSLHVWRWVNLKAGLRELDFTTACAAPLLWPKSLHFQGCTSEAEGEGKATFGSSENYL